MIDFSSKHVMASPRSSLKALFREFERSTASETRWQGGLYYWHTEIAHPWFNGVLIDREPASDETETIGEISHFFARRNVRSHTVWLDNDDWWEAWGKHLNPAGYRMNLDQPGMAIDLAQLSATVPVPAGFAIRQVEDLDALHTWTDVFIEGYELPDYIADPYFRLMASFGLDRLLRFYLGYWNGEPVTASSLFLKDGIAGIYSVATLPHARGQGLGAAITLKPLQDAHEMGVVLGALQSSQMGFRVYQRLGFRKVCDIRYFYY